MKIIDTHITGLKIIETLPSKDHRGIFSRWFCSESLSTVLGQEAITQINQSKSNMAGTVRGLHFQKPPHAETKLVRCIAGKVWDVAVDLRPGSPTFLKHYGHELTTENQLMMIVPKGFAHGYQALEDDSELLYFNTAPYAPFAEGALNPLDPRLSISWPLSVINLSERDEKSPFIGSDFKGISNDH